MYTQTGQAQTNLSNFHRVLCGTASVVFNIALRRDFVEPEIKEKRDKKMEKINTGTADGTLAPAATTGTLTHNRKASARPFPSEENSVEPLTS